MNYDKKLSIVNYDKVIPEDYKLQSRRVFKDAPASNEMCLLCGSSGSGKTNLLLNLLCDYMVVGKLWIFLKDTSEDKYMYLRDKFSLIADALQVPLEDIFQINVGLDKVPDIEDLDKSVNNVLVFDDLVTEKAGMRKVEMLYTLARKKNCATFFLSQSYFDVPKMIRLNSHNIFIFNPPSENQLTQIVKDHAGSIEKDKLKSLMRLTFKEKHAFFTIRTKKAGKERFSKNLSEYFNI